MYHRSAENVLRREEAFENQTGSGSRRRGIACRIFPVNKNYDSFLKDRGTAGSDPTLANDRKGRQKRATWKKFQHKKNLCR